MSQKTHSLSPPVTYYTDTKTMLKGMLDLLPTEKWLELHDEWKQTNVHAVDLLMAIEDNTVQFESGKKVLVPQYCTYCGEKFNSEFHCDECL